MPKIHPTAIVHPDAKIAADVEIGAYCIVESDVQIAEGCVLREHAIVRRYTTLGKGNFIDSCAVLAGEPQDLKFDSQTVSYLRIGNDNVLREGVTISRASVPGGATVVGDRTYFMGYSHVGHDAVIEDEVILVNSALVAGHATIGRGAFLSGHVVVHQFTWVAEGVMSRGNSAASAHVPPFTLFADVNRIVALNSVGLRRNTELTAEDRNQIKEAFRLTYRSGLSTTRALEEMKSHTDWGEAAGKFRDFVGKVIDAQKPYNRGMCQMRLPAPRGQ